MSTTLSQKDGAFPWLMLTGMPSARRCKVMSKAMGVKNVAKDRKEEFYDPARKDNILGRNKTRLELWEEHLKDPTVALDKVLKCVEDQC